jgi:hypothetical protein
LLYNYSVFIKKIKLKILKKVNVISVEYPGYGIYDYAKSNEKNILKDAETIFDYLTLSCKIDP